MQGRLYEGSKRNTLKEIKTPLPKVGYLLIKYNNVFNNIKLLDPFRTNLLLFEKLLALNKEQIPQYLEPHCTKVSQESPQMD